MDKSEILKAFNDHFEEFINDVREVFPDDVDIETAGAALLRLRKMNPKLILQTFYEYVACPYRTEIVEGDLAFFISKDYAFDISGIGQDSLILEKIDMLRGPVKNMSVKSQEKVMKYMQNLVKLASLYLS